MLQLPQGNYTLTVVNTNSNPASIPLDVKTGLERLAIDPIRLVPNRLATLIGKPAPELRGIVDWANGDPTTLAALHGKIVVLDFWGHWCGPCLASMPKLMQIHDAYADGGVTVIAVHDGSLQTLTQLAERTASAKKSLWGDRDLPFRVALAGGGPAVIEDTEITTNCQAVADDGIQAFPTTLLIDSQGNVAAQLNLHDIESVKQQIDRLRNK